MRLWRRIIRLDMSDVVHQVTIVGNGTTGYSETSTLLPPTQGLKDRRPCTEYLGICGKSTRKYILCRTVLGVGSRPVRFTMGKAVSKFDSTGMSYADAPVPPISTVMVCSVFHLYAMQPQPLLHYRTPLLLHVPQTVCHLLQLNPRFMYH